MTSPPTVKDSYRDLLGMELICAAPTCRHSKVLALQAFADEDTVITIAKRARCSKCSGKAVNVAPRWRPMKGSGLPV
jgi:hypothetical protein